MDDLLLTSNVEPQPVCMPMIPSLKKYKYHAVLLIFLVYRFFFMKHYLDASWPANKNKCYKK